MLVNTAAGPVHVDRLGRTLMHEHLLIGLPGWETDTAHPGPGFRDTVAICVDKVEELKSAGFSSLVDPCPSDLGRDVALMGEVAARTGFNIVFATGLYHEELGGATYWRSKLQRDPDGEKRLADTFIRELTEGVGNARLKAGVIKVATSAPPMTGYEQGVFRAAAAASVATGAPITTHTDAVLGPEQLALLTGLGVPANRIVIGHSCGSPDHDYHMRIVDGGAYIGFDRFGYDVFQDDAVRVASLVKLLRRGAGAQVVISHDCVWCWRGQPFGAEAAEAMQAGDKSMRFTRVIAPMLKAADVTESEIELMLRDNPRRYFAGEPLPRPPDGLSPARGSRVAAARDEAGGR